MNNIRIFLSTALIDNSSKPTSHNDQNDNLTLDNRLIEYDECFKIIEKLNYNFEIVETILSSSIFLEKYSKVIYTNVNNKNYRNRGSNYVNAFIKLLEMEKFNDDDIIIHITGRYPLMDDSFFKKCINLDSDKIGVFRADSHGQFYLFMYSMRYKYLIELLKSIDINTLENNYINLERVFSNKITLDSIELVDYLGIKGRQSNSPNSEYGKEIF
jgi:hypothetical protein